MKHSKLKKDIEAAVERQNTRQPLALPKEKYVAPYYQAPPVVKLAPAPKLLEPVENLVAAIQTHNKFYTGAPGRNKNM